MAKNAKDLAREILSTLRDAEDLIAELYDLVDNGLDLSSEADEAAGDLDYTTSKAAEFAEELRTALEK